MSETIVGLDIGSSKIRAVVAERLLTGALQVLVLPTLKDCAAVMLLISKRRLKE